jgi:hypothetical protein
MAVDVTAHPVFDGTFSLDAVASAAHALVDQLHDEAMTTIAALAASWDQPADDVAAEESDEPVTYTDPATWSVEDDGDDPYGDEDEDDDVRVLPVVELPALRPQLRRAAADVAARVGQRPVSAAARALAGAPTDAFGVPAQDDRQSIAS